MASEYKSAGVDVESGYKSVEMIKESVKSTYREEVLGDLGGFGGMFSLKGFKDMSDPILVSGTDGVGTKLKIAFLLDKHDKIGIDCVAMCVNDILCSGAQPLFFLDYIASDKIKPEQVADIVKGISEGCKMAGCALIGGETAEMPGFYQKGEYDLAGFCVGIVNKPNMIEPSKISAGNVIIGIASSGLHSNGYSLVRKVLRPSNSNIDEYILSLGSTLGEAIFKPTKIYVKPVLELLKAVDVKGISHITGGGFIENIPRMIPKNLGVKINEGTWDILPIFTYIEKSGNIEHSSMYNIFNMGIGMTIAVDKQYAEKSIEILSSFGEKAFVIGEVTETPGIEICCE